MRSKLILLTSLCINVILVIIFYYERKKIIHAIQPDFLAIRNNKTQLLNSLPVDSNDIVFVGTSLTEDFHVSEIFNSVHYKNRGIAGNMSANIVERIAHIATKKPKKIFLEMGANDVFFDISAEEVMENYKRVVEIIKHESPSTEIFIQSETPSTGNYKYLLKGIQDINARVKEYCQQNKITFIDMYSLFEKNGELNPAYTYDGIHLTSEAYIIWQNEINLYLHTEENRYLSKSDF